VVAGGVVKEDPVTGRRVEGAGGVFIERTKPVAVLLLAVLR
jgi:hypothetical protein